MKKQFSKDNTLALKGIAIIMMMFHHCFCTVDRFNKYTVSFFPLNQSLAVDISSMFKICVSFFVFVTGYGLVLSLKKLNEKYEWTTKEISKWIINRLIKMMSGFWIIVVLAFIICQSINGLVGKIYFSKGPILGITQMIVEFLGLSDLFGTPTICGTWWYMSIAILFVLSVPLFALLAKKIGYFATLIITIATPRILGWDFVNSSYISFLFPLILGMTFAEKNLMVRFSNFKIGKNIIISKILKFILETGLVILTFFVYKNLPTKIFWEIKYGIIPMIIICYLYEFFLDIPLLKNVLQIIGKYSMNIFLIHTFFRVTYLNKFIYSFENWIKIAGVLFILGLVSAVVVELFKKIIRYDKIIEKIQKLIDKR